MKNINPNNKSRIKPLFREFITQNLPVLLVIVITLLLGGFLEVFPVRYMQQIVNELITDVSFTRIIRLVGLWYGCRVLGSLANFISGYFTGKTASKCGGYFRGIIFDRIMNSYYWDREKASTADVTTRLLTDASELGDVIIKPIYAVGKNVLIFTWSVIFLAQIDWVLLLVCIPLGVVMLALGNTNARKSKNVVRKIRLHETKLAKVILESLSAAREMIVFRFGVYQGKIFNQDNQIVIDEQAKGARLLTALDSSMDALWPLATVACLGLGSFRVLNGDLSIGGLVAFMWYIQWVIHPISQISNYKSQIQKSIVSLERIDELLAWYPGDCEPAFEGKLKQCLALKGVSYHYPSGKNQGIDDITLRVEIGQTVAVVGKTGCGKSTLLKVILGLVQPSSGTILLDGEPISAKSLHGATFSAGAFSEPYIFNTSLRKNIIMGVENQTPSSASQVLLNEAIKTSCVTDFLDELPQGLDTVIGNTGKGLSSGQMQRIALARALFKQPQLLILDEATDSIDSATEARIFKALKRNQQTYACIIVSHRLASVMHADRIYYMETGIIQAVGSHTTLISTCPGYKTLFYSQLTAQSEDAT